MGALRVVLTILFVVDCIALSVIVMLQEGKNGGLGALAGNNESFWSKNKGRSMEGKLAKYTKLLGVLFIVIAVILNLNF